MRGCMSRGGVWVMMQVMKNSKSDTVIVAVSGGLDSIVLLHQLVTAGRDVVVAHVNHGIRNDSDEDERLVAALAKKYQLPYESTRLNLGAHASEDAARRARYEWLESVRHRYEAGAIATAHHQDDVIETMIINMLRGTGWRGVCSLRDAATRHRPLLASTKAELYEYAQVHALRWREDSTNEELRYLRNRVRHYVGAYVSPDDRQRYFALYCAQVALREEVEKEVCRLLEWHVVDGAISRHILIMSDDAVSIELLRAWLPVTLERSRLLALLRFAKTAKAGARWSIDHKRFVVANQRALIVSQPDD